MNRFSTLQFFNCKNLYAIVLSNLFLFYSFIFYILYLLNISSIICLSGNSFNS